MGSGNGNLDDGPVPPEPFGTARGWAPTLDRPWRPLPEHGSGTPFVYDYGTPWCADRLAHPHFQDDGYPCLDHHRTECRSYGGFFDSGSGDDQGGLDGPPGVLSAYLVRPFRFGQVFRPVGEDRLALEFVPREGDGGPFRCWVPASTIWQLTAHLAQTAAVADGWRPPRHLRLILTG